MPLTCLSPDVVPMKLGDRTVLWQRRTGRSFPLSPSAEQALAAWTPALPPPPDLAPLARRLADLHMLADGPAPDLAAMVPARSRLVLLLPQLPALWLPLPAERSPGGHAWAERPLDPDELALWRAMNGARNSAQVATAAGVSLARALAFMAELTDPAVQAVQLRPGPVAARDPALARLVAPDRPPAPRPAHLVGPHGQTTLDHYHQVEISDGATHFDDHETTVAHAFAQPHPALDGLPFGARLHQALEARGLLPTDGPTLEIGPGTGELGAAWLSRATERGLPRGELLRLDRSPELLATQRERLPGSREILGSATDIPLPPASVQLCLCNEVIADLTASPATPDSPEGRAVLERLQRYGIAPLEDDALYNLGAWQLLEELARVLAPGGVAYLSEFGALDERPTETRFLDHPEVSIHFGHLQQVARSLGFEASCLPLPELLAMDLRQRWLARHSYEGLRARMRSEGRHLQARAWTAATVPLPWPVQGLDEVSLWEEGPAPVPTRFMALLLRR